MEAPAARLRSAGPVQNDQDNPPTRASTPSSANRNLFVRGRGGTRRWQRKKGGGREVCQSWHRPAVEDPKNAILSRLQPTCFCLSWGCLLEGERCHWGNSIMACPVSPPSGLHRWLGGPCRELGDEEKMWGRWRTCRETAARKAWRGGSILNGLSTDLIHGLVLGGEWTDRCRCCSAGWVVQVLAAACSSEKEREKRTSSTDVHPIESIPTSPPSNGADDEVRAASPPPPLLTQWHPIVKR